MKLTMMTAVRPWAAIASVAVVTLVNLCVAQADPASPPPSGAADKPMPVGAIIVTGREQQEFKGFGVVPAPWDRQLSQYAPDKAGDQPPPAYGEASWLPQRGAVPEALHRAVCELGFEIARVYLSPSLRRPDGTLDVARLHDLQDHLTLLRDCGVKKYVLTVWSPPAELKLPDHVRWGKVAGRRQFLDPSAVEAYVQFYVKAVRALREAGFDAPLSVSIQNEPGTAQAYDGCVYTDTPAQIQTYRRTVKALRAELDAADFKQVPIIVPETESLVGICDFLGQPRQDGFEALQADPEFARAVGGFAFHTYATAGNTKELLAAMSRYPGRDRWMTEYSTENGVRGELRSHSGNPQLDWTLSITRRMAGDIVDLGCRYWFFWRAWHSSNAPDDQHLLYGDAQKTKAYFVFQKLWTDVRGGWRVMAVETKDSDLRADNQGLIETASGDQWSAPVDLLAFNSPDNLRSCVMLINAHAEQREIGHLSGLRGSKAHSFVTTPQMDMAAQEPVELKEGNWPGRLTLPAWSVTIVTTEP